MFRSATVKLTTWYLCLVMAISLIFSVVVYRVGTDEIARSVYRQSSRIYEQFPVFDENPILRPSRDIDTSDHDLLFKLVLFNIVVLVLAGGASFLLARRTLAPIEEAHEQQKRFTADVSHELRTPLTALKMESEVALMDPKTTPKELRSTLSSNLEEAAKLEALINNLLRLTRLEAGELKQQFESLSSKKLAAAAIKQVEARAKLRDISIGSTIENKLVTGDKASLIQLLVIIMDNAIKYSPAKTTVSLDAFAQGHSLVFKVSDQGVGIKASDLDHVFDRFYRADNSRGKEAGSEGYGLGLSIAKLIADIHDGVISVSSQVNKGTTVEVSLPLKT